MVGECYTNESCWHPEANLKLPVTLHGGYTDSWWIYRYWVDNYDYFLAKTSLFLTFTSPPTMCKIANVGG